MQDALEIDEVLFGQLHMVDAEDDREIGAVGRGGNEHALGARGQVRGRLVARREDAGAFERDVDAERLVRQLRPGS